MDDEYCPYATLNVSKEANLDDIRAAYKRACVLFHPDKHTQDKKKSAEQIFARLQTSYTILSDPRQRDIYDRLGWKGISTAWQLGPRLSGIESVTRRLEEERRRLFSKPMACKTTIQTQIDGTGFESFLMTDLDEEAMILDFIPGVQGVSIGQRFEQVFENGVVASVGMDVLTRAGMGTGSLSCALTRAIDPFSKLTVGFGMGTERYLMASLNRQIFKDTHIGIGFNGKFYGGAITPTFQLTVNKMMMERYMMTMAVLTRGSEDREVVIGGNYISETKPLSTTIRIKQDGQIGFNVKYAHSIDTEHSLKVKVSNSRFSLGVLKVFNEEVKLLVSVEFSADLGTVLKVSFTRYDYHFVFPIMISPQVSSMSIALASALPVTIASAVRSAMKWYSKRRQAEYWEGYRQERAGHIQKLKEDAEMAQWLMQEQYENVKSNSKLLITKAVYRQQANHENCISVMVPLQVLIVDDALSIPPGQVSKLLGFYDVAIGAEKELVVEYDYNHVPHRAIIPDHQPIILPQRSHINALL